MSRSEKDPKDKKRRHLFFTTLVLQIRQDKKAYVVYLILQALIWAVIIRSILIGKYENVFTALLAELLLLIPPLLEKGFHVDIPTTLEILAYVFVFCAEILGEIGNYYVRFPFWDTMLHTFNGFMFAAFGFCLVDIFNKSKRFRFQLSPFFLALVAFCFSMTIGVLWEFLEFAGDLFLKTDMQKDTIVRGFGTVLLPNDMGQKVTQVRDIVNTTIETADGRIITLEGYLDIGLFDTVKDLFVNFIGAVLFSIIGYFYVRRRGHGRLAAQFIPVFQGDPEEKSERNAAPPAENTEDKN